MTEKRPFLITDGVCPVSDQIADLAACKEMAGKMNLKWKVEQSRELGWYPTGCSLKKTRKGVALVYNKQSSTSICRKNVLCICYGDRTPPTEAVILTSGYCWPTIKFKAVTEQNCLQLAKEVGFTGNALKVINKRHTPPGCFTFENSVGDKRLFYNTKPHKTVGGPAHKCSPRYPCVCLSTGSNERSEPPVSIGAYISAEEPCPQPLFSDFTDCKAKARALNVYWETEKELKRERPSFPMGCFRIKRVLYWNPAGLTGYEATCNKRKGMKCVCKGSLPTPPPPNPRRGTNPRLLSGDDWNFV